MSRIISMLLMMTIVNAAQAEIKKEAVLYKTPTAEMEGYVAYETKGVAKKPAVLIVHDWLGLNEYTKAKAEQLAQMGYVGFAVDIFGKGIRPKDGKEAAELAGKYKKDIPELRGRIGAAYTTVAAMKNVDPSRIIVIGYCFGGTTALELARSGARLMGTAVFHAGLSTPNPKDAKNIRGPVLVMHGADDPFVPPAEVEAFKKEMKEGKVRLSFIAYPGAVHSFTIPGAGNDNSKGAAYNAAADKKSWEDFTNFLKSLSPVKATR